MREIFFSMSFLCARRSRSAGLIVETTVADSVNHVRAYCLAILLFVMHSTLNAQTTSSQASVTGSTTIPCNATALPIKFESINVVGRITAPDILSPDPAQRIIISDEALDANPGRPGVPISIPGLPVETASGGIKAPQYFAPGVAGDHGEPIAQFFQIGTYLVPNNLSANAHGNGYADPNPLIPATIESVEVDSGAFNVREGNHAVDLSTTYTLRDRVEPFLSLTGDYRDGDVTAGWSPPDLDKHFLVALEAAFGNGFLDRLEHRQQYKFAVIRQLKTRNHTVTFAGLGYFGNSRVPGLVPLGIPGLHDTIDPRQRDQTHTGEFVVNDTWRLRPGEQVQLSGFFRSYNLSLFSNFGDGLIRQSEYRTVTGGNGVYIKQISESVKILAGFDYVRDAPRRLDLDRYANDTNFSYYGPFEKITSNNLTLGFYTPYVALDGGFGKHFHYDLGWRRDYIDFDNTDLLYPTQSFDRWAGVNSPKANFSILPSGAIWPSVAFSFGETFFTNDPRIGVSGETHATLVDRAHAYQMVVSKQIKRTDVRLTLSRVTTEESLAKIDPDTGLQEDEGPGRNRLATLSVRRYFSFGLVQASLSKADARDLSTGLPTPEAPRTIIDTLATWDKLPLQLRLRSEFEYVGAKPLGDGFISVPVKEFRGALFRSFSNGRIDAGINFLIASGYTGQTLETIALPDEPAPFERIVGVRIPSYVSASFTYRFRPHP